MIDNKSKLLLYLFLSINLFNGYQSGTSIYWIHDTYSNSFGSEYQAG